jgi:FkbM family methyltransferase
LLIINSRFFKKSLKIINILQQFAIVFLNKGKYMNNNEIQKNSLYFDIGANIGIWSLENIKICGKIIAVEPSRKIFEILVKNCIEKNIICLNYAVSNENKEEIVFYESNATQVSTINKNWLCSKESRFYGIEHVQTTCKTISLDKLVEQYGIPDLIKIDVEGAEDLVISSLTQKVKTLCFEWAREFHSVTRNSIDHLIKIGFTKFHVQFGGKYTYVPKKEEYTEDLNIIEYKLAKEKNNDWGMVWAI